MQDLRPMLAEAKSHLEALQALHKKLKKEGAHLFLEENRDKYSAEINIDYLSLKVKVTP